MNRIKYFAMMASVLLAFGCTEKPEEPKEEEKDLSGEVTLSTDRTAICSDGKDAAVFTVTIKGEDGTITDITEESEIYFSDTDALLESSRFATDKSGEYAFYAAYGLSLSNEVKISALAVIPSVPEDPKEDGTAFRHRMLLIQHTGATCPNCPLMMNSLKALSENDEYNDSFNLVASHSYYDGLNDDAYSPAAKTLSATFCSGAYPELTFNLTNTSTGHNYNDICTQVGLHARESAHAGIAMAVEAAEGEVIACVEFKFAEGKTYRAGAWLLEDDIFVRQSGATDSWQHYHNNALRAMYGEKQTENIYGASIGNMKAGDKVKKMFRFPLEDSWKAENCKVMAFVTEADAEGDYDIVNCVICKVGETVSYEYK